MALTKVGTEIPAFTVGGVQSTLTIVDVVVPTGTRRSLVVEVGFKDDGQTVSSVVFNGSETLTERIASDSGDAARVNLYSLETPTETTADVVITMSGGSTRITAVSSHWVDVNQTTPMTGGQKVSADTGTSASRTVTTGATGDKVIVALATRENAGAHVVDTGQTELSADVLSTDGGSSSQIRSSASFKDGGASVTVGYTWTSSKGNSLVAINLEEDTGAAAAGELLQIPHHMRGGFNSLHGGMAE